MKPNPPGAGDHRRHRAAPGARTSAKGYPDMLRGAPLAAGPDRRSQLGVGPLDRLPGGNQVAQRRNVVVPVVGSLRQRGRRAEAMQQIDQALPLPVWGFRSRSPTLSSSFTPPVRTR